jgi:hypothetical protein
VQTFQVRPDEEFEVGCTLLLEETLHPTEAVSMVDIRRCDYSGREIHAAVTHIMRGPVYGLMAGWVAMSINVFYRHKPDADTR